MTTPTNWPNPERPGYPMFPARDGWHFIKTSKKEILPLYWDSYWREWRAPTGSLLVECKYQKGWIYQGLAVTPTQITEMLAAERERCAMAAEKEKPTMEDALRSQCMNSVFHAISRAAANIRNLGDAP